MLHDETDTCIFKCIYIYITYTCMYIMKKSDIEQFKWPYPAMMTQCSTYQAPKNTYRNLKTGLLTDFSQIFSQISHRFLTDFSQISHRSSHRFLTEFLQISHRFLTGFSQISHRLLTDFFLPMAEGNL